MKPERNLEPESNRTQEQSTWGQEMPREHPSHEHPSHEDLQDLRRHRPWRQGLLRIGAGVTAAVLLLWAAATWLLPLAALPGSIKAMVGTTHQILTETEGLQNAVGRVQQGLGKLQDQELLLAEQDQLMGEVATELGSQEKQATAARDLLADLLRKEQSSAALIDQANRTGAATRQTVRKNVTQLTALAAGAGSVQSGSETVSRQMDTLLADLGVTRQEFAPVGRVKRAASDVLQRSENWLQSLVRYFHG